MDSSKTLNRGVLKRQKYNLISEIQKTYDLNTFFNHKLPNYKVYAAFYTLLEITHSQLPINPEQTISNKVTILEHLTAAQIKENAVRDEVLEEIENADRDVKFLTYKILMEKFNNKYDDLSINQKLILHSAEQKQEFANPNAILIDDRPSNIEQWRAKGGIGILHTSADETIEQLKKLGL